MLTYVYCGVESIVTELGVIRDVSLGDALRCFLLAQHMNRALVNLAILDRSSSQREFQSAKNIVSSMSGVVIDKYLAERWAGRLDETVQSIGNDARMMSMGRNLLIEMESTIGKLIVQYER
ncbi:MAG: hypothetical protein HMLIMOIP_001147 [Candidatus Nitrosomirales archaeon]